MKYPLLCIVGLLLCSCIDVDDFSKYWNQAFRDVCMENIARSEMYNEDEKPSQRSMKNLVHSLPMGSYNFLLVKQDRAHRGGIMIRYKIENGEYISYELNKEKRADFERDFPGHGFRITDETVTIPRLNRRTLAIIKAVSEDESYWKENKREPYNPEHNPLCKQ